MKKILAIAVTLTFGLLAMALLPRISFADAGKTRHSLYSVHVPANQSRHIEFSAPASAANAAEHTAVRYTLDIHNTSPDTTAPASGYLNGVCYSDIKGYSLGIGTGGGELLWKLTLTTRFQYDGFQSVRRVGLSSTAVGYLGWRVSSHLTAWSNGGSSWQESSTDAEFSGYGIWTAYVDHVVDSEGGCTVDDGSY